MKISVIGAGNVGATCAKVLADKNVANEIVMLDVKEGVAEGKALDIWQSAPIERYDSKTIGVTNDYVATSGSEVVVITSGIPRKPGMSRDDLISTNANIVKQVTENVIKYSPNAKLVIVSNPLDVMTYQAFMSSGLPRHQVIGMAGILDTGRFKAFIADELNISPKDVHAMLMGGHGDTMVPLERYTTISGIPITEMMSKEKLDAIIERTKVGGGELVKLMGTSAWYAPGAAAARMAEAIARNHRRIYPVCVKLDGEYGQKDVFLGAPVILGKNGIEKIIELDLNQEEMALVNASANHVREVMSVLKK